jgi:hypothetical protein
MPSAGPLPVPVGQCTGHFLAFQGALGENGMEMIPASTHSLKGPYTMFAGAGLGLLLILCLHRYPGINHDAILYLAQGLKHRWPGVLDHDLLFWGGGQEHYTLFPWVLGQALRIAPAPGLFMGAALLGLLIFAIASWHALKSILPPIQRYWAWVGILCLPAQYGVVSIFSYAESFLTPRPFAEALCLFGIAALARRRLHLAAAVFALAALLHPLQSLAALIVVWLWLVIGDRRWLNALWLILPAFALALADVRPFDGLLHPADSLWLESMQSSRQLFVSHWQTNDYKFLLLDCFLLALAWRRRRDAFGKWCCAALLGLLLGVGASLLLVDVLHLVLPAGLQLWRVQWLAHWFAVAAFAVMMFDHFRVRAIPQAMLLALVVQLGWGESDWGWGVLAVLYMAWPWLIAEQRARLGTLLGWLFGLMLLLLLVSHVSNELKWFSRSHFRWDMYPFDHRLLAFPMLGWGLPVLLFELWRRWQCRRKVLLAAFLLAPLLIMAAMRWDARLPFHRLFEGAAGNPHIFGVDVPSDALVYWGDDSPLGSWLVLQRSNYFSASQIAGQVFSREIALEGRRRLQRMAPLMKDIQQCLVGDMDTESRRDCRAAAESIHLACADARGRGDHTRPPDYLVLPFDQGVRALGVWTVRDPYTQSAVVDYRLYSCRELRSAMETKQ